MQNHNDMIVHKDSGWIQATIKGVPRNPARFEGVHAIHGDKLIRHSLNDHSRGAHREYREELGLITPVNRP